MKLLSLLPTAKTLSSEEKEDNNKEYRVIGLDIPFIWVLVLFVILIIYGLVTSSVKDSIDENSDLYYFLTLSFIIALSLFMILFFITDIRLITFDRKPVMITTKRGGKVSSTILLIAAGVFLFFYACLEGSRNNPKGAYPLYVLLGFLILRLVFRFTLKPLCKFTAIRSRKNHCTVPARAEFCKKITLFEVDQAVLERYERAGRTCPERNCSIFAYDYCHEGEYYCILSNEAYCTAPENYDYYDIFINPEHPEKYFINDHIYFKTDKKEAKDAATLLLFLLMFTSPLWIIKLFDFIAEHT